MAAIPKIISQRLQAMAELRDHPDANLLTAFVERSLKSAERVRVLGHLAACSSCREVVSFSAMPETSTVVSLAPSASSWLFWPALRWGAAVACVVVVGAVVTLHQKREPQQMAAVVTDGRPAEARNSEQNTSSQLPGTHKTATASPKDANHPVAPASPIEMADARTGSPLAAVVPGRAKDALAEPQNDQSDKFGTTNYAAMTSLAPRWTLSADGTLQRSLDTGATWQTIVVSSKTVFRALAANDLDIWVGGSAGALFHSSDAGEHWTQVRPIANGEALEDDIVGVEFTDTLHGKLTSSAEETWITADAGQTWQKQ
jgi:photosynthesis system II assembly factor YCF48-like protein/putative zinc finger protein